PPLIFTNKTQNLKTNLNHITNNKTFLLQNNNYTKNFTKFHPNNIHNTFHILLQITIILTFTSKLPIIKINHITNQFTKPQ
ncbi:3-deoxy-7-phosphoheptulonate synthase class II, partial [Enterococcus hirae]